jgi:tetratricopeptide (TPR) repeat protein
VKDCERLIVSLSGKLYWEPEENPLDKQGYVVFAAALLGNIKETHEKIAALANNVSTIYYAMGQLEKALDIREKVLDKNHPDLALSYHNLSFIYRDMEDIAAPI